MMDIDDLDDGFDQPVQLPWVPPGFSPWWLAVRRTRSRRAFVMHCLFCLLVLCVYSAVAWASAPDCGSQGSFPSRVVAFLLYAITFAACQLFPLFYFLRSYDVSVPPMSVVGALFRRVLPFHHRSLLALACLTTSALGTVFTFASLGGVCPSVHVFSLTSYLKEVDGTPTLVVLEGPAAFLLSGALLFSLVLSISTQVGGWHVLAYPVLQLSGATRLWRVLPVVAVRSIVSAVVFSIVWFIGWRTVVWRHIGFLVASVQSFPEEPVPFDRLSPIDATHLGVLMSSCAALSLCCRFACSLVNIAFTQRQVFPHTYLQHALSPHDSVTVYCRYMALLDLSTLAKHSPLRRKMVFGTVPDSFPYDDHDQHTRRRKRTGARPLVNGDMLRPAAANGLRRRHGSDAPGQPHFGDGDFDGDDHVGPVDRQPGRVCCNPREVCEVFGLGSRPSLHWRMLQDPYDRAQSNGLGYRPRFHAQRKEDMVSLWPDVVDYCVGVLNDFTEALVIAAHEDSNDALDSERTMWRCMQRCTVLGVGVFHLTRLQKIEALFAHLPLYVWSINSLSLLLAAALEEDSSASAHRSLQTVLSTLLGLQLSTEDFVKSEGFVDYYDRVGLQGNQLVRPQTSELAATLSNALNRLIVVYYELLDSDSVSLAPRHARRLQAMSNFTD